MGAEVKNLLTGSMGERRLRVAALASDQHSQVGMQAIMRELGRLNEEIETVSRALETARLEIGSERARTDSERARADTQAQAQAQAQAERDRANALQVRLDARNGAIAEVESELAGARAQVEGLQRQLATEQEARASLKAPLEQAIAAAAKPPLIVPAPAASPLAYELDMTNRDLNGRMRSAIFRPIAERKGA